MGGDLILGIFTKADDVIPDFQAGHTYIDKLVRKWKSSGMEDDGMGDDPEAKGNRLHADLKDVEQAYIGKMRDCTELDLFGHSVYVAGGTAWGDSPSETMDSIHNLEAYDILDKCGFNTDIGLDYAGILSSVLECEEALPLLMGKHAQLDKLINKIFRKE